MKYGIKCVYGKTEPAAVNKFLEYQTKAGYWWKSNDLGWCAWCGATGSTPELYDINEAFRKHNFGDGYIIAEYAD